MSYVPSSRRKEFISNAAPTHCPITGKPFSDPSDISVDHDHYITGKIRGIISRSANVLIGKAENHFYRMMSGQDPEELAILLRRAADYIEQDFSSMPYHWEGVKQEANRFARHPAQEQRKILIDLGISPCSNQAERKKQYMNNLKGKK